MGKSVLKKASLIAAALIFFITISLSAQEKKDDGCCSSGEKKCENMDHSKTEQTMMDHSGMSNSGDSQDSTIASVLTVKKVDSSLAAWNAVCPVRGEEIDPEANKVEYNGKIYGFCCNGCDSKFSKDPEKYLNNLSEDGKTFIGKR
jgi:YHS domain-containing protein